MNLRYRLARTALWLAPLAIMLGGCAGRDRLPPQAPPAMRVDVPIPVACRIEQVAVPAYPAAQARPGMSIYELSKIALADRRVRMAENERLRAANNNPCPGDSDGPPHQSR